MEVILYISCAFLLTAFLINMVLALRGDQVAKYSLWAWAALTILALPPMNRANMIPYAVAGLMLVFFLYMFYIIVRYGMEHVGVPHEETRRVLTESSRRTDEERRTLARRLHDEVNPQLLLTHNVLKRLELLATRNGQAAELLGNASGILNDIYAKIHDIIRNTRIEVTDFIGFVAVLEPLVAHCTNISEEPAIMLKRDLPGQPTIPEASAISAYKTIREAISDAIKHSKITQVHISIHHNKVLGTYKVETIDDGMGTRATARNEEHADIGLIDVHERARVPDGALKIRATDPTNQKRPGTKLSLSPSGQLS